MPDLWPLKEKFRNSCEIPIFKSKSPQQIIFKIEIRPIVITHYMSSDHISMYVFEETSLNYSEYILKFMFPYGNVRR